MKKLVLGFGAVAVIYITVCWFAGKIAEKEILSVVEQIQSSPIGSAITIEPVTGYERGLFSSTFSLQFSVNPSAFLAQLSPQEQQSIIEFTKQIRFHQIMIIDHGPLLLQDGIQFGWVSWKTTFKVADDLPALQAFLDQWNWVSKYGFNDNLYSQGSIVQFNFQDETDEGEPLSIELQNVTVASQSDIQLSNYRYSLQFDRIALTAGELHIVMDGGEFKDNGRLIAGNIWALTQLFVGDGTVSLASLDIRVEDQSIKQKNMSWTYTTTKKQQNLEFISDLTFENIVFGDMEINDTGLNVGVNNVSIAAMQQYQQLNAENMKLMLAGEMPDEALMQKQFMEIADLFLQEQPELKLNKLRTESPFGVVDVQGSIRYSGAGLVSEDEIFKNVELALKGYVPASLLALQVGDGLTAMIEQGYMQQQQENVHFEFMIKQGQAYLGGKLIPLSDSDVPE